jgi:hypothetical protein
MRARPPETNSTRADTWQSARTQKASDSTRRPGRQLVRKVAKPPPKPPPALAQRKTVQPDQGADRLNLPAFERGLRPRNLFSGGCSKGGRSPPRVGYCLVFRSERGLGPRPEWGEDSQAAQKGPDARRRPRAAREAYSLYVERAAAGANFFGGGRSPPPRPPPRIRCAGKAGARKWNTPTLSATTFYRKRKRNLSAHCWVFRSERGLHPRPEPGEDSEGAVEAPPRKRRRWAFFSSLPSVRAPSPPLTDLRPRARRGAPGHRAVPPHR